MKISTFLAGLLAILLLSGCTKNRFGVSGNIEGADMANLHFIYFTSDSKKGWMTEQTVPVVDGRFSIEGVTRKPTVVYVMSGSMEPLCIFYAERGDKITIEGDMADPEKWKVTGNVINEEWSAWRAENPSLRNAPAEVRNNAVKKYVEEHPDSKLSALLMLTAFDRNLDEAGFNKLWSSIDDDARPKELTDAVGRLDIDSDSKSAARRIAPETFYSLGDTLATVKPAARKATIFFFWSDMSDRSELASALRQLKDNNSSLQVADLFMKSDSTGWRRMVGSDIDSLPRRTFAWLHGAQMNRFPRQLGVTRVPFFIVSDSRGTQIYRGEKPLKAAQAARRLLTPKPSGNAN